MLGESALALALQQDQLIPKGGILTPATALGRTLIERLKKFDFKFEIQKEEELD